MILVIDVSDNNGVIDLEKIKADGVEAVLIRAGFGSNYESQDDKQAERVMNECERLRIPYGLYIYSYCMSADEARSEAEHALRIAEGHNPVLGIYIDMEDADGYKERHGFNPYEHGAELTEFCNIFMSRIQEAGFVTGTYANKNWFDNILARDLLIGYKWLAIWGPSECPVDWAEIWQYSSDGEVNGSSARTDMNQYVNEANFYELIKNMPTPSYNVQDPIPERDIENVGVRYHVGDEVEYTRIWPNSGSWDEGAVPYYTTGTITAVYEGTRHPYLIGNGTGFIDDSVIVSNEAVEPTEAPSNDSDINVGDEVRVLVNAQYGGGSFLMYHDTYEVMEVNGDRAVIGKNGTVTTAINVCNIEKVGGASADEPEVEEEVESSEDNVYTVEPGDSFWSIADKVYGDGSRYRELAERNGLDTAQPLYAGMELAY